MATQAALVKHEQTLPEPVAQRGITSAQWRTLVYNLYPGANPTSVLLVWDYCVARKLDPLKKPCHIVPMQVKDAKSGQYEWRDVVMPGIYELRTTAQRTGQYLGHSKAEYGPELEFKGVKAPEWCEITVYRWNAEAKLQVPFPVRVYFREVVGTRKGGDPNDRWTRAPIQMLTKCAEAAALREAFPDEIGGEQTAEEMDGQRVVDAPTDPKVEALVKPDGFDDWLVDITSAADEGWAKLEETWGKSREDFRNYLTKTDAEMWDGLKQRAVGV